MRRLANHILPPAVKKMVQILLGRRTRFLGHYADWAAARAACDGYGDAAILERVLSAMLQVKSGAAAQERDGFLLSEAEPNEPVLAVMRDMAARHAGHLKVVDLGGALGTSFFQAKQGLDNLSSLDWCVVEQLHYVEAGQRHIAGDGLWFSDECADALAKTEPHIVLISSSLQYFSEPFEVLAQIGKAGPQAIIFDRIPVSALNQTSLTVQHVPKHIYKASYPMWIFSPDSLADKLTPRFHMADKWVNNEGRFSSKGNLFDFTAMVWERNDD
jgi:putative methyltransferase (TIGR04325 family)